MSATESTPYRIGTQNQLRQLFSNRRNYSN